MWGGEFLSNPLRAAVSYQTVYAPLRIGDPFVHVVGIDVRANLLDWIQVQGATYVTPAGQLRYTVSGSVIRWTSGPHGGRSTPKELPAYVVHGMVRDTDGQPVEGAVLHVGNEVVITDSAGRFSLRSSASKPIRLFVALEEFLAPGRYDIVSAPETVSAEKEGSATVVTITIRRR